MKLVLLLFVSLILIVGGVGYQLNENGYFVVRTISVNQIDENHELLAHEKEWFLRLEKELEAFRGQSLIELSMEDISDTIKQHAWIKEFRLSRRWPSHLSVHLRLEKSVALLISGRGQLHPVLKSGEVLDPIQAIQAPDLPVLDNKNFHTQKKLRQKAIQVLESLPRKGSFSNESIATLKWKNKEGFEIELIRDRTKVTLGQDDIEKKALRVSQVLDYLESRSLIADSLNADLTKKVIVRMRASEPKSKSNSVLQ